MSSGTKIHGMIATLNGDSHLVRAFYPQLKAVSNVRPIVAACHLSAPTFFVGIRGTYREIVFDKH
ncbi:MAG: hypothetical protein ABF322_04700, partial [Lentimonas sp.]